MKILDSYPGQDILFEGKRTLYLKSIPVGAQISSARITVTAVNSNGDVASSIDEILFDPSGVGMIDGQSGRFASRTSTTGWVEVDFHGRRRLVNVSGSIITGSTLQVDIGGGSFIEINSNGAFKGPDGQDFQVGNDNDAVLPGLTVSRIKLTSAEIINISAISILNTPHNVSLALGETPAFWIHPGELIDSQSTADFSQLLQAFISDAESDNGFYNIPLVIHSDTLARLNVDFEIDYHQQLEILPAGVTDISLPYDYNGSPQVESNLLNVTIPVNARIIPGQTNAQVLGSFDRERIAQGPLLEISADRQQVEINPQQSQAQRIQIAEDVTGSSFDFLLKAEDEQVNLQLDIRVDLDGKPNNASLLSEPINFSLSRKEAPTESWHHVELPLGFRFEDIVQTKKLWLIIQSLSGTAGWVSRVVDGPVENLLHSQDGGLSWRKTILDGAQQTGFYRLRHVPAQFEVPVELQVGVGEQAVSLSLDRFNAQGRVDFNLNFNEVADTINQFIDNNVNNICPQIEHIANGDFSLSYENEPNGLLPVDWELTLGSLAYAESGGIHLGNADLSNITGLSQLVPVSAGCQYELEIYAVAEADDAVVEIIWLGDDCAPSRVDRMQIPVITHNATTPASINLSQLFLRALTRPELSPTRAQFNAPENVQQAEIRIRVPEQNRAFFQNVSLLVTPEKITNPDFKQVNPGSSGLTGWNIVGELDALDFNASAGVTNISTEDFSLVQAFPVLDNKPFNFTVTGRSFSSVDPNFVLVWLNENGDSMEPPIIKTISTDSLLQHHIQGMVPTGSQQLELHINLVPQSTLDLKGVSFQQLETIEVPLNLISQTPGELSVSDFRVAYETLPPRVLQMPAQPFCDATPADIEPGDVCEQKCFCTACQGETQLDRVEQVQTPSGRPATVGRCENCGLEISRLGGELIANARVFPGRRLIQVTQKAPLNSRNLAANTQKFNLRSGIRNIAQNSMENVVDTVELMEIKGIGESRNLVLLNQGITTIDQLTRTNTAQLARMLEISPHQADEIKTNASTLLSSKLTRR